MTAAILTPLAVLAVLAVGYALHVRHRAAADVLRVVRGHLAAHRYAQARAVVARALGEPERVSDGRRDARGRWRKG